MIHCLARRIINRFRKFGSPEPTLPAVPEIAPPSERLRKELHDTRDRVQTLHHQLRLLEHRYRHDVQKG